MNENMILNLGGGGSNPLNFKVVGGTKPSNPKENTIWVNTDKEITGWQFASDDPNLLDFNNWANNVDVQYGSKAVSGNSIALTANANDCYTNWDGNSNVARIPCVAGRTYILEWEHSGAPGEVYLFPSGGVDNLVMTSADTRKLELTPVDGVTFFTFRVGVRVANTTATYSNMRITEKERAFKPGSVWIQTGTTSPVSMNVLKKNSIQVCPLNAKQYVGGAWADKTAKTYQGGTWVDWWNGELFDNGNQYDGVTGGWVQGQYQVYGGENATGGTITIGSTIQLKDNGGENCVSARTNKKIDLTRFNTVTATFTGNGYVFVASATSGIPAVIGAERVNSIDVSALSGEYYVGVMARNYMTMSVSKINLK